MYMFFWFFKQTYYIVKRFFKNKILVLLLFFILFLLLRTRVFATEYGVPCHQCTYIPTMNTTYDITRNTGYDTDKHLSNMILMRNNNDNEVYLCFMYFSGSKSPTYHNNNYLYLDNNGIFRSTQEYSITIFKYNPTNDFFDWYNWTGALWTNNNMTWLGTASNNTILGASTDIYTDNTYTTVYYSTSQVIDPYIDNSDSEIENWSFTNLVINGGDFPTDASYWLHFTYPDTSNSYDFSLTPYTTIQNDTLIFTIPKSYIQSNIVIRSGSSFTFGLEGRRNGEVFWHDFGAYTLSLTEQEQTETNEDSNKEIISNIENNQKETNKKLDNIENTITNSTIDDNSISLPTDNTNDITRAGINGIFTSIYNAFCTGEAQDIVFPIPFTNKIITLQANYVRQMLQNNNANWIITIIEAFWWYLISRFIISDISNKINKIKSGNIENIENSNIKGDML